MLTQETATGKPAKNARSPITRAGDSKDVTRRKSSPAQMSGSTSRRRGGGKDADRKPTSGMGFHAAVGRIDARGIAQAERQRQARHILEDALEQSLASRPKKTKPTAGLTHRDVWAEKQLKAQQAADWAATLQNAVLEGVDNGVPDALLEKGVQRILELEEQVKEEEAAATEVAEARGKLASMPVKTPVTKKGSAAAKRAAAAGRTPLGEGSLVQLKDLQGVTGIRMGCFDINLEEYNGRKGRVSREPPPWTIKAIGSKAGEQGGSASQVLHDSGGLVPVLLDSRSTDADRHRGVWLAIPPANLKVLQQ